MFKARADGCVEDRYLTAGVTRVADRSVSELLRRLPAVGIALQQAELRALAGEVENSYLSDQAARVLDELRALLLSLPEEEASSLAASLSPSAVASLIRDRILRDRLPRLRRLINASGVVLHTNLGRAPLAGAALEAAAEIGRGYSNLEFDLEKGERGSRFSCVEGLLCALTGAEAGYVVNNNAAAVLLVLSTLAEGREVIVSRGELVEIGGSFRLPDVMARSGARLVETGTTNKTYLRDYENAVNPETAMFLKVHPSNFRIVGFTASPSIAELVRVGREKGIAVVEDQGSGILLPPLRTGRDQPGGGRFEFTGFEGEPSARESIAAGADLVTFSGDKLLGGPQAGIIVGRKALVEKLRRNHLARALRIDKLSLAALEATLRIYMTSKDPISEIPVLSMLSIPAEELRARAEALADRISSLAPASSRLTLEILPGASRVGGGALPTENLPTWLVALFSPSIPAEDLSCRLRGGDPPVIGRVQNDRFLLDPRTLLSGDSELLPGLVLAALQKAGDQDRKTVAGKPGSGV
ncbi:MAG: L-seryl-tRNA(Sec) selenium transferase [Firmicutes bacterium]|nr:L-seryl-tRNA(Sec) selenium transferase [Bacillota bacterium]